MRQDSRCLFSVADWFIVTPSCNDQTAWKNWAQDGANATLPRSSLDARPFPAALKRRLRAAGLLAAQAIYGISKVPENTRFIFASRHGEFRRNLALLYQLVQQEDLSPTDFSLSVHNAIAGLISIANGNHAGHTALAAGHDSFCAGMLEACVLLRTEPEKPVLLVYYDEPLPDVFSSFHDSREQNISVALLLESETASGRTIEFSWPLLTQARTADVSQVLLFMQFFLSHAMSAEIPGSRNIWSWRHVS